MDIISILMNGQLEQMCFISTYLTNIGGFLISTIKVLLVLGFLIFIHELGHFMVAKWAGIKVHEFALGFGKILFSRTKGETVYSIRAIPMGGFVRMEGEEEASEDERAFNKKPLPARLAVVFAGPLMNILFAFIIVAGIVFYYGNCATNTINRVVSGSGADKAGIKAGDKIVMINGTNTATWDDINWLMGQKGKSNVNVKLLRNNSIIDVNIPTTFYLNITLDKSNKITEVGQQTGLDKLGIKVGQRITSVNGISVTTPQKIESIIKNTKEKEIALGIEGTKSPKKIDINYIRRYIMGIEPVVKKGTFQELLSYSIMKNIFLVKVMTIGIIDLVTGNISLNQVMGPVGIITEISSQKLIIDLLWLSSIISLNLGLINLVPFPPLDGGKILTLCIEGVRRKPIAPENEAMISMIGFSLLILLMIIVTFNDIIRYLGTKFTF